MNKGHNHSDPDQNACLYRAAALMQEALELLDQTGESRAAAHLQHALDTLDIHLPPNDQPH